MTRIHRTCFFLLLAILPLTQWAQTPEATAIATIFDHWYTGDDQTIDLRIHTNLGQLFRNPDKEVYQEAEVSVTFADGSTEDYSGKVRLRGNMRREVCQIPPLKLKFKKKDMTDRGWLPHNDLKIVLPCRSTMPSEQDLIAEFLTYRMYGQMSALSLRVQMVRIHLTDSEGRKNDQELLAFIIEPVETLAARFALQEAERTSYRESFLEKDPYRQMAFFQYMIGNTDWNVYNGHNLKFIGGAPFKRLVAVPYDFDYSAVVGTSYAVPHESLPIRSVTQRLYRGLSCEEQEALDLIQFFSTREAELLQPVQTHPLLEKGKQKEMLNYLEGFFRQLDKTKGLVAELK
ncbi:hypothetical protein [Flavilitoribacter nigricans]|uniref:YARHG domain-containing protein n=1 Tax=Flavilitoribacter nigricans (strain ATCC 23147 / DSM 23189 / NBRC 102662 / NCIMB 1420 / SS-2) TaxID=1122177 RepID=A0A2D0MWT3_FLAN2|nr:hypothetical protein [Flavilitoribacter nigricans]PHN00640.1 hypothetical protein CRP01_41165 [Flavilitoribacter nigricans DSM 23189 = NBRC 102662]